MYCPILAAKELTEGGRLLIGWSSVRVVALEALSMICFKCMGFASSVRRQGGALFLLRTCGPQGGCMPR